MDLGLEGLSEPCGVIMSKVYDTREAWLMAAVAAFRPWFEEIKVPLPEKIRVACSWAKRAGANQIGWCWKTQTSADGTNEVMISPEIAEPVHVLATLIHELDHATDNGESKHSGHFRDVALQLGLTGPMTATTPGPVLSEKLDKLAGQLGPYPHAEMKPALQVGKQGTRMLKAECPDCGYLVRLTRKWAEVGMPVCPCGVEFELQEV